MRRSPRAAGGWTVCVFAHVVDVLLCACCSSYLLYRELAIPPLLVRLRHVWFRQSG